MLTNSVAAVSAEFLSLLPLNDFWLSLWLYSFRIHFVVSHFKSLINFRVPISTTWSLRVCIDYKFIVSKHVGYDALSNLLKSLIRSWTRIYLRTQRGEKNTRKESYNQYIRLNIVYHSSTEGQFSRGATGSGPRLRAVLLQWDNRGKGSENTVSIEGSKIKV